MMAYGAARADSRPSHRETISMSHAHHDQHGGHEGIQQGAAHAPLPFSAEEIAEFQRSDRQAGGSVVVLMALIFTTGVLLYGTIDYLILP
jgi:hypothetical protein